MWDLRRLGIRDEAVLEAMMKVPRHKFVPTEVRLFAYENRPLPIGYGQTISQPYIVALMTELLAPTKTDKILEIGTGSGYQAAILAELAGEVFSLEVIEPLARRAEETLRELGYTNVRVRVADGYYGWKEEAPFQGIIVTCAPERIPPALVEQLAEGGRMVIPLGPARGIQRLCRGIKEKDGLRLEEHGEVVFVPFVHF
ncbi:MAG: protein-L-isoaspartate(D-aspartate) O-methyltransferase [Firmicutes bacterium]|nr:protein-L-isoaspartate(D-aspartate) O-methyltransferase [Bacillota bacterium]